jgi:undecaprenyl pyrophosphate synthase
MAGKVGKRKALEREFEELLLDVLEQDYDLTVRHGTDRLDRRKRDVATLQFEYHYDGAREAKAVVRVAGVAEFKAILPVDFASADGLRRSAEDCEALVLYLTEYLEEQREKTLTAAAAGRVRWGRREDD